VFESHRYRRIRFGDITDREVARRGLPLSEQNEKMVREDLRRQYGMAAYAELNLPDIEQARKSSNVVLDGLYSWEEYKCLAGKLGADLKLVAVWAPPELRYSRLGSRKVRPLTADEARARDHAEIENVNKGGPIAMADYTIKNDSTLESLVSQTNSVIEAIK